MLGITLWSDKWMIFIAPNRWRSNLWNWKVKDVAITEEIGGRSRVLKVILDKDKMAENGIDPVLVKWSKLITAIGKFCKSGWGIFNNHRKVLNLSRWRKTWLWVWIKIGLFIWDKLPPFRMDLQQPKVM
jgi:hypothetical protein